MTSINGRSAQTPAIHRRLGERAKSTPLLPFTISSGTGGERQKAGVGATGRMRQERSSVNPPYTDGAVLVGRCLGDIAGRTEQPRRTRAAPPVRRVASAFHYAAIVHGNGWVDEVAAQ